MKKLLTYLLLAGCFFMSSCQGKQASSCVMSLPEQMTVSGQTASVPVSSWEPSEISGQEVQSNPDFQEGVQTDLPEEEMDRLTQMFNIFWIAQADVREGEEVPLSIAYTPFMLIRDTENTADPDNFRQALQEFWGRDVPLFEGKAPAESLIPLSLEDGKYFLPSMGLSQWHETVIEKVYSLGNGRYRLTGTTKYKELGEDGFSQQTVSVAAFQAVVQYEEENRFHFQVLSQQYRTKDAA